MPNMNGGCLCGDVGTPHQANLPLYRSATASTVRS